MQLASADVVMTPESVSEIAGAQNSDGVAHRDPAPCAGDRLRNWALNKSSWMGTSFPDWEGPISFAGSHKGVGYLEMTGY